jgi:predicted Zn finger-like uncharacterized protein
MAIRFVCPSCQTSYTVDDKNAGKKAKCAKCGEPIDIPAAPAGSSEPPVPDQPSKPDGGRVIEYIDSRSSRRDRDSNSRRSSRRDRDDDRDYDDRSERSRGSRRRRQEQDDYGDEPIIRRRQQTPHGQGLAITSMILGICGLIVSIGSGGPAVCSMCCFAFAPFVWAVSGFGGVLGVVGLVLGFVSRNAGNRSGMSTSGIVTGGIAVALAVAGIVVSLAFPAALLMNGPPQGPVIVNPNVNPNPPVWPQPKINQPPLPNFGQEGPKGPAGTRSTEIHGGHFDPEFVDAGPQGSLLIGLEIGLDKFVVEDVVYSVRPIYRVNNREEFGKQHGKKRDRVTKVVARPGYAVGAITIKAGLMVDGLSITFMKLKGAKLDPTDSYESEWVGGMGGGAPTKLGGDGSSVVGIVGHDNGDDATGLGLLLKR